MSVRTLSRRGSARTAAYVTSAATPVAAHQASTRWDEPRNSRSQRGDWSGGTGAVVVSVWSSTELLCRHAGPYDRAPTSGLGRRPRVGRPNLRPCPVVTHVGS